MKIKKLLPSFLILISLGQVSIAQDKPSLKGTMFNQIGHETGLDPLLLYSIALTESAISQGKGFIRPHPYVFRSNVGGPKYFDTKEKAAQALKEILNKTANIDVGMMQINLKYHPQPDPSLLFDAEHNLQIAATILKEALSTSTDPIIGVGRYHSSTPHRTLWYGQRVWKTYQNLTDIFE